MDNITIAKFEDSELMRYKVQVLSEEPGFETYKVQVARGVL